MSLVLSLLQAIVRVDGDALVMHAGDRPYVVSPTENVDLAHRGLTLEAVNGIVGQFLPPELQKALDEFGAVQYEMPPLPEFPGEQFTVVAARGGDDVWTEIRRRRVHQELTVPGDLFAAPASTPVSAPAPMPPLAPMPPPAVTPPPAVAKPVAAKPVPPPPVTAPPVMAPVMPPPVMAPPVIPPPVIAPPVMAPPVIAPPVMAQGAVAQPPKSQPAASQPSRTLSPAWQPVPSPPARVVDDRDELPVETLGFDRRSGERSRADAGKGAGEAVEIVKDDHLRLPDATVLGSAAPSRPAEAAEIQNVRKLKKDAPKAEVSGEEEIDVDAVIAEDDERRAPVPKPVSKPVRQTAVPPPPAPPVSPVAPVSSVRTTVPLPPAPRVSTPSSAKPAEPRAAAPAPPRAAAPPPPPAPRVVPPPPAPRAVPPPPPPAPRAVSPPTQPAVVLPILRSPIRSEQPPPPVSDPTLTGLERLLRVSSARGASALYLSSGSQPSVRVDGELQLLDGEPVHVARDVESLLLTLMPERSHEALRTGAATEWICELEGVGRVRCMSFRDHLGPGGVFRLMPTRSVSADQLGLPQQIQNLAIEPEGIVLIAGPRSSGKRTLIAAFVDLMNRTRRDHIITIEREINIVHERGHSFISQREVRGDDDDLLAASRAALREDPDVLVIEDLRTGPLMNVALEAAASGRLVVGGFSAHTATGAVDRIIDLYAPDYRRQVQFALADSLRAIIVQALLRKVGGGRLPAREVLLNTPAVSSLIAEGKTSQLPMAIEGGRRYGMMPLNDALVGLVQNGTVEAREAYRQSPDRQGFLAALNRQGIDTSFVERLA